MNEETNKNKENNMRIKIEMLLDSRKIVYEIQLN